jgi:predicted N-acetyltransferase YhbS
MAISQITADEFAGGEYVDEISRKYIGNSHYDWESTRLIWDGERLVHHWGVWGYPMRLGAVQLRVAGIGAVVTREPYRRQGLMHRAALDSLKAIHEKGYDLSILRGRHYAKFGYVRAWNYVTYKLTPEEIPEYDLQMPYKPLGPEHMDEIIALYNQSHLEYAGMAVRPTYRMLDSGDMGAYGWFDSEGVLVGYVRAVPGDDKNALRCLEATGDAQQGLAVLADLFKEGQYETLNFFTLPYQHPILRMIRKGACLVEERYFFHSGWQVRLVNLRSTLEKLQPLLESRLATSEFDNWHGQVHLDAGDQSATLQLSTGSVQISDDVEKTNSIEGGAVLVRLLIGSDEPGEVIQQEGIHCTGGAADLAEVLFPNLNPMMSHWDEF